MIDSGISFALASWRLDDSISAQATRAALMTPNNCKEVCGAGRFENAGSSAGLVSVSEGSPDVWLYGYDGFNRQVSAINGQDVSKYTCRPEKYKAQYNSAVACAIIKSAGPKYFAYQGNTLADIRILLERREAEEKWPITEKNKSGQSCTA